MPDSEPISVRRDHLLAASALVPEERRAAFFATILVGPEAVSQVSRPSDPSDDVSSFPLTLEQARELKAKLDDKTWAVIRSIAGNVADDVGTIDWSEVKRITGVGNWSAFAKGRMAGVHRSLRKLPGVPTDAILLWEGEGWVEDGKGDFSAGTIGIDGPAVRALRLACGLRDEP